MLNWKKLSLRAKTLGLMGGFTLLFFVAGLMLERHVGQLWKERELGAFDSFSAGLNDAIAAQFFERYGDVQAFAANGNLLSPDAGARESTLNKFVTLYGIYDSILLLDTKGNVVSTNSLNAAGETIDISAIRKANFSDAPWFKAAMAGNFTEDKSKGFSGTYVENFHKDQVLKEVFGKEMVANSFTTVVRSPQGKVVGVITARAGFRWVGNELLSAYRDVQGLTGVAPDVHLLAEDGLILASYSEKTVGKDGTYTPDPRVDFNEKFSGYSDEVLGQVLGKARGHVEGKDRDGELQVISYYKMEGQKFIDALGWRLAFEINEAHLTVEVARAQTTFVTVFGAIGVLGLVLVFLFARGISNGLVGIAGSVTTQADAVTRSARQVQEAASSLAGSTQEQAAAVEQTVSAIDEVSVMVAKSADNARESLKVAEEGRANAERGVKSIEEMIRSIQEIQESNQRISAQVEAGNQQFASIATLIGEIGQKTKVINDIVFQTKLLSFNASVEAARAGENGKGFAVVAEEVGNLAQMSGNAAKEITELLENSVRKVEQIAEETTKSVKLLMEENSEKVSQGSQTAKSCADMFHSVMESVAKVSQMANEISTASSEQAQGVSEITKAMNQLGQVSQENARTSEQSSAASGDLLGQADEMRGAVEQLSGLVLGEGSSVKADPSAGTKALSSKNTPPTERVTKTKKAKPEASGPKPDNVVELKPKPRAKKSAPAEGLKVVGGEPLPVADDPRFEEV